MGRLIDRLDRWAAGAAPSADGATTVRAAGAVIATPTPGLAPTAEWGRGGEFLAPVDFGPLAGAMIDRAAAMTIPAISRGRDLICSTVGALPITAWQVRPPAIDLQLPAPTWANRPDPNRTRQWQLAWTADDLLFYGVAYWHITARLSSTYPQAFARLDVSKIHVHDDGRITYGTVDLDPADVVEFLSPIEGLLSNGWRALSIALNLDDAADRFAATELPNGVLEEQDNGEDLTADELTKIAENFARARRANTIAATNKYVRFREVSTDPSKMQLVEARTHQALDMARLSNVPAYMVGAPAGTGMTYLNTEQARADLLDFGAMPYVGCIEQTLSGPNVTPAGTAVRLATSAWLRTTTNPATTADGPADITPDMPTPGARS